MLLKLTHQTDLNYSDLISESIMEVRMAPRQEEDQHRLSFTLAIGPATPAFNYFDWLGNTVHWFTVNSFHRQIRIIATSVVETDRPLSDPRAIADTWPLSSRDYEYSVYDFLQFGGPIVDSPQLRALADELRPAPGAPLGELAMRMLSVIGEWFTYQKGVTTAASPITDILEKRSGVCQDFTHLMIGLGRALGIPSRYVSGLVHPDAQKYRGFTQTHAWCEMLFPSVGWIGFDPANNCVIGDNFVKVGVGRSFNDVPPNKGLYKGAATESMEVTVHSEELAEIPSELAAERVQSIAIPTYVSAYAAQRDASQQQEQQQQ
ncbi:MAG TPA: transglutaminase family protein [Humisphaera sp.]|jgi:transglutaminase-like putative cysteine protease|nr:transglutaminase family protein [Humisphaera sp.]